MALYEIAILGDPSADQIDLLTEGLKEAANNFQLLYGTDLVLLINPNRFEPEDRSASVAVFFGSPRVAKIDLRAHFDASKIPILPVASNEKRVGDEMPESLKTINCLLYDKASAQLVPAVLSSLGLMSQARRVFLSYKRTESTPAAIQLFGEISARRFDVFLDTHSVNVAEEFQEELWHQLCDSDILVLLQTPDYFKSRWTMAEWGRALSKGIGVLSVDWPDSTPSIHTGTASRVELIRAEINADGTLAASAIERICLQIEKVRITSQAVRHISLITSVDDAVTKIGGRLLRISADRTLHVTLVTGRKIAIQPRVGVPTSLTAQEALERAQGDHAAVVYDHLGIRPNWQRHLRWLGEHVPSARWVKASEAGWTFAGWDTL